MRGEAQVLDEIAESWLDSIPAPQTANGKETFAWIRPFLKDAFMAGVAHVLAALPAANAKLSERFDLAQLRAAVDAKLAESETKLAESET